MLGYKLPISISLRTSNAHQLEAGAFMLHSFPFYPLQIHKTNFCIVQAKGYFPKKVGSVTSSFKIGVLIPKVRFAFLYFAVWLLTYTNPSFMILLLE